MKTAFIKLLRNVRFSSVQINYKKSTRCTKLVQRGGMMNILRNPTTIKSLAKEINKACDEYLSLKLSEDKFKALIWHYGQAHGKKLFNGPELNSTLLNRIGKRRAALIEEMLKGFQIRII